MSRSFLLILVLGCLGVYGEAEGNQRSSTARTASDGNDDDDEYFDAVEEQPQDNKRKNQTKAATPPQANQPVPSILGAMQKAAGTVFSQKGMESLARSGQDFANSQAGEQSPKPNPNANSQAEEDSPKSTPNASPKSPTDIVKGVTAGLGAAGQSVFQGTTSTVGNAASAAGNAAYNATIGPAVKKIAEEAGAGAMRGALTGTPGAPMSPDVKKFVDAATKEAVKSTAEQLGARETQEAINRSTANAARGAMGRPTIEEKEEKTKKEEKKKKERKKKSAKKIKKKKRPSVKSLQRRSKKRVKAVGRALKTGVKTVKQKFSQGKSSQKKGEYVRNIGL